MLALMRHELSAERIAKLRSVLHYSGLPIDARSVTDDILGQEGVKPLDFPIASHGRRRRRAGELDRLSALGFRLRKSLEILNKGFASKPRA